jgi:hypothetical protein
MALPADWFVGAFLTYPKAGAVAPHRTSTATEQSVAQTKFIPTSLSANFSASPVPIRIAPVCEVWAVSVKKSFGCGDKF